MKPFKKKVVRKTFFKLKFKSCSFFYFHGFSIWRYFVAIAVERSVGDERILTKNVIECIFHHAVYFFLKKQKIFLVDFFPKIPQLPVIVRTYLHFASFVFPRVPVCYLVVCQAGLKFGICCKEHIAFGRIDFEIHVYVVVGNQIHEEYLFCQSSFAGYFSDFVGGDVDGCRYVFIDFLY